MILYELASGCGVDGSGKIQSHHCWSTGVYGVRGHLEWVLL